MNSMECLMKVMVVEDVSYSYYTFPSQRYNDEMISILVKNSIPSITMASHRTICGPLQ